MDRQRRIRVRRDPIAGLPDVTRKEKPEIDVGAFVVEPGGATLIMRVFQVVGICVADDGTELTVERLLDGQKKEVNLEDVMLMTDGWLRLARVKLSQALIAVQSEMDLREETNDVEEVSTRLTDAAYGDRDYAVGRGVPEEVAERFNEYARARAASYQTDDEDPPAEAEEEDDPPLPRRGRLYREDYA